METPFHTPVSGLCGVSRGHIDDGYLRTTNQNCLSQLNDKSLRSIDPAIATSLLLKNCLNGIQVKAPLVDLLGNAALSPDSAGPIFGENIPAAERCLLGLKLLPLHALLALATRIHRPAKKIATKP